MLLLVAAVALACVTLPAQARDLATRLADTRWQVETLHGERPVDPNRATLAFARGRQASKLIVSGTSLCNRYSGPVRITGRTISVGRLAGTRRACLEDAANNQERLMLDLLDKASTVELVANRRLILTTPERRTLVARRVR
jgi:heat shock protein HslJ